MDLSIPLLAPEIVGRAPRGPLRRLVEHPRHDGRVPARQPGSGKAKAPQGATLIPSRAAAERSASGLCRARKGVGRLARAGLRDVPFPPERAAASLSAHHATARGSKQRVWKSKTRPAAAVIPAPIAYIKVVAVKKLVVEPWAWLAGPPHRVYWSGRAFPSGEPHALRWACRGTRTFTLKKLECSKQAFARIR